MRTQIEAGIETTKFQEIVSNYTMKIMKTLYNEDNFRVFFCPSFWYNFESDEVQVEALKHYVTLLDSGVKAQYHNIMLSTYRPGVSKELYSKCIREIKNENPTEEDLLFESVQYEELVHFHSVTFNSRLFSTEYEDAWNTMVHEVTHYDKSDKIGMKKCKNGSSTHSKEFRQILSKNLRKKEILQLKAEFEAEVLNLHKR